MSELFEACGCGRPVRYMIGDTSACNKYRRCKTREELEALNLKLTALVDAYRDKRAVDGLNGRPFDAVVHFESEGRIEKLERLLS